jgi:hypothetical protein
MDKKIELKLVKKYPKILRDYRGNPMQTCMAWGMEFDNGWENLIDICLHKLQYFCDLCAKDGRSVQVVATQLKEKMAALAFYFSVEGGTSDDWDIIDDIISGAEVKSAHICEISGEHGYLCSQGGWYKTLCYEEARKLGYKACNPSIEEYWAEKDKKKEKND